MKQVVAMGLHEKTAILAGIGPVRSLRAALFMKDEIAGMDIPTGSVGGSKASTKRRLPLKESTSASKLPKRYDRSKVLKDST